MNTTTISDTARGPRSDALPAAPLSFLAPDLARAVERACGRIAPTWPLDRFIAVNPFWEMTDEPLPAVSARLAALSGTRLLMPRSWYFREWEAGRLRAAHLEKAAASWGSATTVGQLTALLEGPDVHGAVRARVVDVIDAERDPTREMSIREFITNATSQLCAAYFDEGQAELRPDPRQGLYATFRQHALADRSPSLLMGLRGHREAARALPRTAAELISIALLDLDVPEDERESYLTGLLLDLNGWAAWCAYLRWTARLAGGDDPHLVELLAVRLASEWLLLRTAGGTVMQKWQRAMASWGAIDRAATASQAEDWLLQEAVEIAWQEELCAGLSRGLAAPPPASPSVQALFCIDVRSEVFRRALEAEEPTVQTLGFAGFFGLPIEYLPVAAAAARPQLPGFLSAKLRVTDTGAPAELGAVRRARLDVAGAWRELKASPVSTFAFVEATGLLHGASLLLESAGHAPAAHRDGAGLTRAEHDRLKPRLTADAAGNALTADARPDVALGMLRAMSLTRGFARLVVLAGHGSSTRNNPHAAGLDCGACCGQTGEVNARVAAALLNDPDVRAGLSARGVQVPSSTHFVAALHCTTTDEVALFDRDEVPASHAPDLAALQKALNAAGDRARTERAAALGLPASAASTQHAAMLSRAADWAEVRPEWGLAGNAAFVVAPRERTRHLNLAGRSFLHDYRYEDDPGFAILELIMTAPMVVTHWINFQYYASTVDNARYGSGNKVLHDVVGGHLGVFEGNGGDLRIGLPMQSLHDGARWMHDPLRLSVFVEAPTGAIDAIVAKHAKVRSLVDNGWLHLFQIDAASGALRRYRAGQWVLVSGAPA